MSTNHCGFSIKVKSIYESDLVRFTAVLNRGTIFFLTTDLAVKTKIKLKEGSTRTVRFWAVRRKMRLYI